MYKLPMHMEPKELVNELEGMVTLIDSDKVPGDWRRLDHLLSEMQSRMESLDRIRESLRILLVGTER